MKILGLSAFYHDSACVLIDNGELVCAVQEERFTRKKHDSSFPIHSIRFCLDKLLSSLPSQNSKSALNNPLVSKPQSSDFEKLKLHSKRSSQNSKNISYQEVLKHIDYIAYYDKSFLSFERLLETYLDYAPFKGFSSFKKSMPLWLGGKLDIRSLIKKELKKQFDISKKDQPELLFNYHHLSHASSSFYPSPYKNAAILCLDGVGEWATTSSWIGDDRYIQPLWQINFPHSLGLFYSTFTEYCGFKVNSGEYKLMGLAPYGEPKFVSTLKDNVIEIKEDGSFQLNMEYFDYPHSCQMSSPLLYKLLKKTPRKTKLDSHYMDVASSVQKIVEEVVVKLSNTLYQETKMKNLCMAGGVALNCVANEKILNQSPFQSLWIQPAAGDAGGALGSAYSVWHAFLKKPRKIKTPDAMKGALLGPSYSSEEIEQVLKTEGAIYTRYEEEELIDFVIKEIIEAKVVAWFQGAMEFGPRALGCRSILGDARIENMQTKINQKIKFRESFRPFAISILEEKIDDYFEKTYSPYMLLVSYILPAKRKNSSKVKIARGLEKLNIAKSPLPSCTHVDYSCRIQTVGDSAHPRYRKLLEAFYKQTACPGLINTSFNVRGEPIVCSPYQAWRCFMNTDIDICVINDCVLKKSDQKVKFKDLYIEKIKVNL